MQSMEAIEGIGNPKTKADTIPYLDGVSSQERAIPAPIVRSGVVTCVCVFHHKC